MGTHRNNKKLKRNILTQRRVTKLKNESRTESEPGQEVILPDIEDGEDELTVNADSKRKTNKRKEDKRRNKKDNNAEKVENIENDQITIEQGDVSSQNNDLEANKLIAEINTTDGN